MKTNDIINDIINNNNSTNNILLEIFKKIFTIASTKLHNKFIFKFISKDKLIQESELNKFVTVDRPLKITLMNNPIPLSRRKSTQIRPGIYQ